MTPLSLLSEFLSQVSYFILKYIKMIPQLHTTANETKDLSAGAGTRPLPSGFFGVWF